MATYIGTDGNDTLIGSDEISDDLTGKLGNDVLIGGDGSAFDWAHYDHAPSAVTVNLAAGTSSGGDGADTITGIEGAIGSKFDDILVSGMSDSSLYGGDGNDSLVGGEGSDTLKGDLGNDVLTGGSGWGLDTADYSGAVSGVTVNLVTGTATGGDGNDTLSGIEEVVGSEFSDTLVGNNTGVNYLKGGDGDDSLTSGNYSYYYSNNELDGGSGNDSLVGGEGNDTLTGGLGNDLLTGGGSSEWGGGGPAGSFYTAGTFDTANYSNASSAVTVNLSTGNASGGDGNDILNGIESAIGSSHNDTLIGDVNNNSFQGNDGSDTLVGGYGNDDLDGGNGNDSLVGGEGSNVLVGGQGDDVIKGNGADQTNYYDAVSGVVVNLTTGKVSGGSGNDTLSGIGSVTGSSFNDTLTGNTEDNTLDGNSGDDWLMGGSGDDWLMGGKDIDWASYNNSSSAVVVNLSTGIASGGAGNDTIQEIENVQGSKYNDTLTGDDNTNTLDGKAGNNVLTSGEGNDIFKFTVTNSIDKITDYKVPNDTIQLEDTVFGALKTTGTLAAGQFRVGSQATDTNDFIIYNKTAGTLLYDADGNGAASATQIATLSAGLDLTNADIVVI